MGGITHSIIYYCAASEIVYWCATPSTVPGSFRETTSTYYELLGVERNKYINISELLCLDLSRLVPQHFRDKE